MFFLTAIILVLSLLLFIFSESILTKIGEYPVVDQKPAISDAVVVLNTGVEYYPRLIEAADLFRRGLVDRVVINGNRKTDVLRGLEQKGFRKCCPWQEDSTRILSTLGVPREKVISISAEDVYDTVSEAKAVGDELLMQRLTRIIITTSKSHTRRAHFIWSSMFKGKMSISVVSAKTDPYNPHGWWKEGRQIRWVMAEYGAWVFYYWKKIME